MEDAPSSPQIQALIFTPNGKPISVGGPLDAVADCIDLHPHAYLLLVVLSDGSTGSAGMSTAVPRHLWLVSAIMKAISNRERHMVPRTDLGIPAWEPLFIEEATQ